MSDWFRDKAIEISAEIRRRYMPGTRASAVVLFAGIERALRDAARRARKAAAKLKKMEPKP